MYTLAQKPNAAPRTKPGTVARRTWGPYGREHDLSSLPHDLDRVRVDAHRFGAIQPKLKVSAPTDMHEQEADRVADRVMRMSEPQLQRMCVCGGFCPDCRKRQGSGAEPQAKRALATEAAAPSAPPVARDALRSPGHPLDSQTRTRMQQYFWYDLSSVQVHTGGRAARSARDLNALAYTIGSHIVFANGAFAPATPRGRHLLAHELVHVGQQAAGNTGAIPVVQRKEGEDAGEQPGEGTGNAAATVCADLRSALADSVRVIELYKQFLDGNVTWDDMTSQIQTIGNAAQGVTGAGREKPKIVQDAINEVEEFGFEELGQMGSLALTLVPLALGSDDSFHRQWVTNEIERQRHYNLVLFRLMYENACPDVPGTWAGFQEQILPISRC